MDDVRQALVALIIAFADHSQDLMKRFLLCLLGVLAGGGHWLRHHAIHASGHQSIILTVVMCVIAFCAGWLAVLPQVIIMA